MSSARLTQDADPYRTEGVEIYDKMLHQTLSKILGERHFTSDQRIKELLRNDSSTIKPILEQERLLSEHFSKEELEKLPLLWMAVLCRYKHSVELLVRSGVYVNETLGLARIGLNEESTVLHAMLLTYSAPEHERLIRLLTDHGANLRARDSRGETVLHLAVRRDRVELAEMFLERGADVSVAGDRGRTPFALVDDKNLKNPMVKLIIKALALKRVCQPLMELKDESLIKDYCPKLWNHYEDCIEHVYRMKFTRFAKSCTFFQLLTRCPCSIALLMRADPDFERNFGLYDLREFAMYAEDLLRALERGQLMADKVVRKMSRSSPCKSDCENAHLLRQAILEDRVELTEWFLEKGADVNAADDHGMTALLLAARNDKADRLLPLLLKHGANVFAKDSLGGNVLYHLAWAIVDHVDQARALIEMGVSPHERSSIGYQPIHLAALRGNNELMKLFLDHGAHVNALGRDGESPLYRAARARNPEVLKTLLKRGADIHSKTTKGRTALHEACCNLNEENIGLLLSAGADVLVEDHDGKTPFSLVLMNRDNRNMIKNPCIRQMIKALALKNICLQPSVASKDERRIERNWELWDYYRDCHAHIFRMKMTTFFKNCTFFDLLAGNHCRIAKLMRNPAFGANFELYDLSGFAMYADDVLRAFERAQGHYHSMLEQEDVINEALDYILPSLVVRKVVNYIFDCCENVKCV